LGRTFQVVELCDSLTVVQNVMLGREASLAGVGVRSQVLSSPSQRRDIEAAASEAIELCGIADLADQQAGALSTGQRRLVELARCLAGPFDVLLLDEPSSGLDSGETARFGDIVVQVVQDRGVGILLVEHDMDLVMRVCSEIYVLDFGELIFAGSPDEVAASPIVRAAYLGDEGVMEAVGGGSAANAGLAEGVTA
jgi:ABC-type branched-subunit amino acid transport system ATPase component